MLLDQKARALIQKVTRRASTSAHDTASVPCIPTSGFGHTPSPESIDRLIEQQRPDGSWGGAVPDYHDRLLYTMAAILTLREHGRGPSVQEAIRQGERYLCHSLHLG